MKISAELTIRKLFFKKRFKEKYPCSHKQLIQTLGLALSFKGLKGAYFPKVCIIEINTTLSSISPFFKAGQ